MYAAWLALILFAWTGTVKVSPVPEACLKWQQYQHASLSAVLVRRMIQPRTIFQANSVAEEVVKKAFFVNVSIHIHSITDLDTMHQVPALLTKKTAM